MNQSQSSYNLKALLPLDNYQVILNEKHRFDGYSKSQNIIHISEQASNTKLMRRKSCQCDQCGKESAFQYKMMNFPLQKKQQEQKELSQQQEENLPFLEKRKSNFYKTNSFNSMKISVPKNKTENSNVMLNVHGFQRILSKQSSFVKLLTDGMTRSQKKMNTITKGTQSERSSFNSLQQLNQTNNQSFQVQKRIDQQIGSPLSLFSPKRKNLQQYQRFQSTSISKLYHVNFKQSSRKLHLQPLKIQNQTLSSSYNPKLSNNIYQ